MTTPQIVIRPVSDLRPYARNARTHSHEQIEQLAASIREFGFTNPVLATADGMIVAGHGRIEAAKLAGVSEVPTLVVGANWTPAQLRAYVLADNQLALNAGWDRDTLREELAELQEAMFDISIIGFDALTIDGLLASELVVGLSDEDEVPEPPERPVTRPGDLWLLGKHRLLCGDSTVATDVDRLLDGVTPLLMVTDPPYGVEYDPAWRNKSGASATKRTGKVLNDDRADWREAWALFPGDVAYVWHGALHAATVAESLEFAGLSIRSQIIWAKDRLVLSRGDYHWQHEPCWYAVKKTGKGHWSGDRKQATLWQIPNRDQDAKTVHGTQKPVECMRRPMLNNSSPGQAVYEPFMGSGTTLIAAETTGRVCLGIELNPAYVDVALERWQAFSGKTAILAGEDRVFDDLKTARKAA
jgi:DNA modification methylase